MPDNSGEESQINTVSGHHHMAYSYQLNSVKVSMPDGVSLQSPKHTSNHESEAIRAARIRRAEAVALRDNLAKQLFTAFQKASEYQQEYLRDQENIFQAERQIKKLDKVIAKWEKKQREGQHRDDEGDVWSENDTLDSEDGNSDSEEGNMDSEDGNMDSGDNTIENIDEGVDPVQANQLLL